MPIERKSQCEAIVRAMSAAAGTSIIAPTSGSGAPGATASRAARAIVRTASISRGIRHHRHEHPHDGVAGDPEERAQLWRDAVGGREREPDPARPERAAGRLLGQERRRLVAAEVERPHGRDAVAERLEHGPQHERVLLLGRPRVRFEERELAAQEADALGAGVERGHHLGRGAGVREQADRAAVGGAGRLAPLAAVAVGLLGQPLGVVAQPRPRGGVGRDPHHAPVGVDADLVAEGRGEHARARRR